jgi:hypothetical protein
MVDQHRACLVHGTTLPAASNRTGSRVRCSADRSN